MKTYDYLVVGSGCSGAMAAQTLVEAGVEIGMVDVGVLDESSSSLIPKKDFLSIRKTEKDQYKYFIGERGQGIAWGGIGKGAQVTPPRQFMTKMVDKYLPLESKTFSPVESLGYGGLGIGWGLQCWEFSNADMRRAGLDVTAMRQAYDVISERIGVSASKDAAENYTIGTLKTYQKSPKADKNHQYIQKRYASLQDKSKLKNVHVGRTPLALITDSKDGRSGYKYRDMDYYSNDGSSAWRPSITVDELRKQPNFSYVSSFLATHFSEKNGAVTLFGIDTKTNKPTAVKCRRLVLASGALGSARIVIRSLGEANTRLPMLSNPHSYIPCVQPAMVGKESEPNKLGFGQLSYFIDKYSSNSGLSVASSYSYQSLMMFRIINQVPLNLADARVIMRYLLSGLIIMIVQHPDSPSSGKYLQLVKDPSTPTGDKLSVSYSLTKEEERLWKRREKQYIGVMRRFRTYALKRVDPGHGSSIHYAGTIPFSKKDEPFTLSSSGRLHGTSQVYVADSSGFNYLPAPGLTFSLMANAHLVARGMIKNDK